MPTVFLSYRHENDPHRARVRALAERLRREGGAAVTVILDQLAQAEDFHGGGPDVGWPPWSVRQSGQAERVLVVASGGWFRCYEGKEQPGTGLGAASEAGVIQQRLYRGGGTNPDIRIVFFEPTDAAEMPIDLERYHRFDVERDFADLLAWLTGGASVPSPTAWAGVSPVPDWPLADFHHVREAIEGLLTEATPHRILLIQGPSEVGKSCLTRHLLGLGLRLPWLACGRFDLKAGTELHPELRSFVDHLDIEAAVAGAAGRPVVERLDLALAELRRRARPTLLIFDTFEQGGECARWVEERALVAAVRAPWLRVVVTGQRVPGPVGASWAAVASPPIVLQQISCEDWHSYGRRTRPDLKPDDVRLVYDLARGRHSLLAALLGPGQAG